MCLHTVRTELPAKVLGGTAAMAMVYSGEAVRAIEEQPENMRFAIPEEGSNLCDRRFCNSEDVKKQRSG